MDSIISSAPDEFGRCSLNDNHGSLEKMSWRKVVFYTSIGSVYEWTEEEKIVQVGSISSFDETTSIFPSNLIAICLRYSHRLFLIDENLTIHRFSASCNLREEGGLLRKHSFFAFCCRRKEVLLPKVILTTTELLWL